MSTEERGSTPFRRWASTGDEVKGQARRAPWCFYCGRVGAWFTCDCSEALEARNGKRVKPKFVKRGELNVMVLEPELLERPWNKERLPVYEAPVVASTEAGLSTGEEIIGVDERRRRRQAEWARAKRAKQRGG